MPTATVAFPFRGEDGSERLPGQVVELSEEEAHRRVKDGFVRLSDRPVPAVESKYPPMPTEPPTEAPVVADESE